ncbi:hypothetical protein HUE46_06265 [Flavobacterium columnare]|uniref:RHS repeat domain-containing protein n=1 Tax=Flavobacterium columnare TaxID=996 RepID=UPI00177C8955|nr:RHS repeat-associated core domain-containing protein [Flavobacterium columnare]QOG91116.1 hypothetical protein HUE41_06265 [Flavobacterium columnare]QOG93772.1 hypothetical protein HUE42_06260 [Flavobacterium columnare]QOG96438.1 hypothetical protein HUE43_06265 [Flavobacterium columnare]QOG99095.1 hypothetical protein HUE44_06260 [Flavobacterium columnare]QOH01754.1 hypothetical protein HUE45_06260 [Flavobacterium columnare]
MKYYPFGSLIPNRHGSSTAYRYGYQGSEKDDEIKGEGNSMNYTFRMHDPRVGRFFATDPLENKYPWYSPYQFGGNSPIMSVELEGLEESKTANENQKPYSGGVQVYQAAEAKGAVPGGSSHANESFKVGEYSVLPNFIKNSKGKEILSHYTASVEVNDGQGGKATRIDYVFGKNDLATFKNNVQTFGAAANLMFGAGTELSPGVISILNKSGYGTYIKEQMTNPLNWLAAIQGSVMQMRPKLLNTFDSIDDVGNVLKKLDLDSAKPMLLKSGWTEVEGNWGTRVVFEKKIGKQRFYAQWENNVVHSSDNRPVSYWKITSGKINATRQNTIRVSKDKRFTDN